MTGCFERRHAVVAQARGTLPDGDAAMAQRHAQAALFVERRKFADLQMPRVAEAPPSAALP